MKNETETTINIRSTCGGATLKKKIINKNKNSDKKWMVDKFMTRQKL